MLVKTGHESQYIRINQSILFWVNKIKRRLFQNKSITYINIYNVRI